MSGRTVYGNSFSSNGWPMVDTGSCTWVNVPGTSVTLQIQNGWPLAILRAFAADFNAYVEPLRDADSACWTSTNSVSTSNHLSGTAMDLNWDSHPFQVPNAGFDAAKIAAVEAIQDFYEGMVFWGNDWSDPKDAMHFQLSSLANGGDINTYNNPAVGDFIARKIRADGFSTFRRDNTPVPPPVTQPLSRADGYAVKIIAEGQRLGITARGIQIALSVALVETNLTMYANSNDPPSLNFPHDAVGSDHMSSGLFQQQTSWGPLADRMDATKSATIFFTVDNGGGVRGLTKIRNSQGVLYDYNDTSRSPGFYAQTVQGSAFPDRYDERFDDAVDLYNRLANTTPGDDMAQVPQAQWDAVYQELTKKFPSRSPLRHLDQTQYYPNGLVDTFAGMTLNDDGMEHVQYVIALAGYNHPDAMALLNEVAGADPVKFPDRAQDIKLAQAILNKVAVDKVAKATGGVSAASPVFVNQGISAGDVATIANAAASAVQQAAPTVVNGSTGQKLGAAYDSLEALKSDLTPAGKATVDALIGALQTEVGVTA